MSIVVETTGWLPAPVRLSRGAQEFAIGDVHGHAAHFAALLDAMADEAGPGAQLTLLGDLIDRGPHSLPALRLAVEAGARFAGRTLLLGNHEICMLLALSDRPDAGEAAALWQHNGGSTTLREAGLPPGSFQLRREEAAAAFRAAVGADALALLDRAPLSRNRGNLLFVHAGIDPAQPLALTIARERLDITDERHPAWIREPFLHHEGPFAADHIVVHGHTPEPRVLAGKRRDAPPGWHRLDGFRLGLDGGSYATGVVTGAEFRDGGYRVFTAAPA